VCVCVCVCVCVYIYTNEKKEENSQRRIFLIFRNYSYFSRTMEATLKKCAHMCVQSTSN